MKLELITYKNLSNLKNPEKQLNKYRKHDWQEYRKTDCC